METTTFTDWSIIVSNENLEMDSENSSGEEVNYINFDLDKGPGHSNSIPVGNYLYDDADADFGAATIRLNNTYGLDDGIKYDEITDGNLSLSLSGSVYTINFDGVINGQTIKCTYKGKGTEILEDL
jgi:hypothetical protein